MKLELHNDYLIGFPSEVQDKLEIKGPNGTTISLLRWGVDISKYENIQTVGVVLDVPRELYGPNYPIKPSAQHLRPANRLARAFRDGTQGFEGMIKEGVLPVGTLVVVKPGWQALAKRTDSATERMMDEKYAEYTYSVVQPQCIMAYCNPSTNNQWAGYAGMVMLDNFEDTTELKSKIVLLQAEKKVRQNIRKVIGEGTCMESGYTFDNDSLVYCLETQGAPIKINAGFPDTKIKNQSVTFVPASTIIAAVERQKNMKYTVIPKAGRVAVRPDKADERWSEKIDLIKPAGQIEPPNRGEVIAVGKTFDGGEMETKIGESVLYPKGAGSTIEINGEKLLIIYETDLWASVEEDEKG